MPIRKGRRRFPRSPLALAAVLVPALLLAAAPARADEAAAMYQPETVVVIRLTLPPASIEALEADPEGEYQEGFFSMAYTDGLPDGVGEFSAPIKVGIRLKGGLGSFRELGEKAAFKVKFSYVKKQKFLGLKKMTLNNMVQDPSMLHERLAYESFRALGVPASRTGYAYVFLNGEPLGVYLNIEDLDDIALAERFGGFEAPPQHLYEGEYGVDVTPGSAGEFEVDEGEEDDRGDLEALIDAVGDESAPSWSEGVSAHADLAEMTRMWAVEKYIGHWDGYAGQVAMGGTHVPNNYFLYSDPSGRFQMLPWGTDQTWEAEIPFEGDASGVLYAKCKVDPTCQATFRAALGETLHGLAAVGLGGIARCTASLLSPWQQLEAAESVADPLPFTPQQIAAGVAATRQFVASRPGQLASFLSLATPAEASGGPCDPPSPAPGPDPSSPPQSPPPPAGARATLGPVIAKGRRLRVTVHAPGAGAIRVRGEVRTKQGSLTACAGRARAETAGKVGVTCRLGERVWRRLGVRWLRLHLRLRFLPAGGGEDGASRTVRLRHRGTAAAGRAP